MIAESRLCRNARAQLLAERRIEEALALDDDARQCGEEARAAQDAVRARLLRPGAGPAETLTVRHTDDGMAMSALL
ncbi:MAG TPA: hypothetical protein VNE59_13535 [Burkholderiales bacterium]|nr:hypothetical protein [Burkholderiales bacterium]